MNEGNLKRKGVSKMKEFKTITEHEILRIVWLELLDRILKEEERNEQFKKEKGRPNSISEYHIKKLNEQIKEIHNRILEIEQKS